LANRVSALLLLCLLALPARAELLKTSLLGKAAGPFRMKLDIFNGNSQVPADQASQKQTPAAQAETLQKSIAEEIAQSISYEGFIVRSGKKSALLNVSGEFFVVGEQETILDKIKILKISKDVVTIEYEKQPYDIRIKGDQNG
jgi:hypothetical protein